MSLSRFWLVIDFWSQMKTWAPNTSDDMYKPVKTKKKSCVLKTCNQKFQISYCKDAQLIKWPCPDLAGLRHRAVDFCEIIVIIMKIFWEILSDWRGLAVAAVTTPSMSTQWVEIIEPRTKVEITLIFIFSELHHCALSNNISSLICIMFMRL